MSDAASFVTKYPSELSLVIVLVAIIMAFMTGAIVPGKMLSKRFESLERRLDKVMDILLFKGKDD